METQFKIGDEVRIKTLKDRTGGNLNGVIGHVGIISEVNRGDSCPYHLQPSCIGGCWPEECLELVTSKTMNSYEIY